MPRPAVIRFEDKFKLVLAVISGEMTVAEAARRSKVSEQSIGNWKRQFLEGGQQGLADGSGTLVRAMLASGLIDELNLSSTRSHAEPGRTSSPRTPRPTR